MARLICSWCNKVLDKNYQTATGEDSHGVCPKCLKREFGKARKSVRNKR